MDYRAKYKEIIMNKYQTNQVYRVVWTKEFADLHDIRPFVYAVYEKDMDLNMNGWIIPCHKFIEHLLDGTTRPLYLNRNGDVAQAIIPMSTRLVEDVNIENIVPAAWACPKCGERDMDILVPLAGLDETVAAAFKEADPNKDIYCTRCELSYNMPISEELLREASDWLVDNLSIQIYWEDDKLFMDGDETTPQIVVDLYYAESKGGDKNDETGEIPSAIEKDDSRNGTRQSNS